MYSLTEINKLQQWVDPLTNDIWFIIDVPNPDSPTGYDTYKVNPDSIQGYRKFIDLEDTPPFYVAPNVEPGMVPVINPTSDGLVFESPKLYDSGWKTIPIYNGSYGLANTGNVAYRPKVRVVGNILYLTGLYLFPMPTSAGGTTLDTNGFGYTAQDKNFSDLYTGLGDGYSIDGINQFRTRSAVLPEVLQPIETIRGMLYDTIVTKTKNVTDGRMRLSHFLGNLSFLPDGTWIGTSIEAVERNGDLGTGWNRNLHSRKLVDKFRVGDKLMNYDNYRNAFDSDGGDTLRVPNVEGFTFDYDFDGSRSQDLGGFFVTLNAQYSLNPAYTQAQIKTAFDSL